MKILNRILSSLTTSQKPESNSDQQSAIDPEMVVIAEDLSRLDSVQNGLGSKALEFVLCGENEAVLSTVKSMGGIKSLEVCQFAREIQTNNRRRFLARMNPYDVPLAVRYTQLLDVAVCPPLEKFPGGNQVPVAVRVFFYEALTGLPDQQYSWPQKILEPFEGGLLPEQALVVTQALGGDTTDFFDVMFNQKNEAYGGWCYLYLKTFDLSSLILDDPDSVVQAGHRMMPVGKENLLYYIRDAQLLSHPAFLELALDFSGDKSKIVRETAVSALKLVEKDILEPLAERRLVNGTVHIRASMVELLVSIGSRSALQTLKKHLEKEKTARIIAVIDLAVSVEQIVSAEVTDPDDGTSYVAMDGSRVGVPTLQPLKTGEMPKFDLEDRNTLLNAISDHNVQIQKQIEEYPQHSDYYQNYFIKDHLADNVLRLFRQQNLIDGPNQAEPSLLGFLSDGPGKPWVVSTLDKMPQDIALRFCSVITGGAKSAFSDYLGGAFRKFILDYLKGSDGDMRHLDQLDVELGVTNRSVSTNSSTRHPAKPGDILRKFIPDTFEAFQTRPDEFPVDALWPYVAEQFDVLDCALGLKSQGADKLSRVAAIGFINILPKPPMRYLGPLLEAATDTNKAGQAEARAMLTGVAEVESRLLALLDDKRQAIRASAAEWLAERADPSAAKALHARMSKEKSELTRAVILTALDQLGEDLSLYLSPDALLKEAEAALKKMKSDKLSWMPLEHLPMAKFKNGNTVAPSILKFWLWLAFKLKKSEGHPLFEIYLAQLDAQDAESFALWVLESWISYDTLRPTEQQADEYAKSGEAAYLKQMQSQYRNYKPERAFSDLKQEYLSQYLNSGAASKGLLALAKYAAPVKIMEQVKHYLKNHDKRVSQTSSLLAVLASVGDPVSLQLLTAVCTENQYRGRLQNIAEELLKKIAQEQGWTRDELSDRTIPNAGLDDQGKLLLNWGEGGKHYQAKLNGQLTMTLHNPEGKVVKALPAAHDDVSQAARKQFSSAKKELKELVSTQVNRIYEGFCTGREWPLEDWIRDYRRHPVMRKLTERLIWLGSDESSRLQSFRPTAEGDCSDSEDRSVALTDFTSVRLAHVVWMDKGLVKQWVEHLKDYEVQPLFQQFGRSSLLLGETAEAIDAVEDRKGWVSDTFKFRGQASTLGYERGEIHRGVFREYCKTFRSAGLLAIIEFSGSSLPEENIPAALISLSFLKLNSRFNDKRVKLDEVSPVLLSECWNDYRQMAEKAVYDEKWKEKMLWM